MSRLLVWLRRQHFAVVYDLQGSLRSRIMTWISGARRRIGRRPDRAYTHAPDAAGNNVHAFDALNRLLQSAGIRPVTPGLKLEAGEAARQRVADWLQAHEAGDSRLVLVHAGSSERWLSKRWDEQHYAELATQLEARDCTVVWIGGEPDRALNRRLSSLAAFALVSDSGPMHILAAAGLPVYAFFGPTDWRRSHAPGQQDRVLTHPVPCSPCHLPVCPPEKLHRCLDAISPVAVILRLEKDGVL